MGAALIMGGLDATTQNEKRLAAAIEDLHQLILDDNGTVDDVQRRIGEYRGPMQSRLRKEARILLTLREHPPSMARS